MAVALYQLVGPLLQIEERHELASAVLHLVTILSIQTCHESQELGTRQLLIDERPIGDEPELRFRGQRILGEVYSGEVNGSRCRLQNSRDHSQRRRLPRAVGTEEGEELPLAHREADAVDRVRLALAIALDEVIDLDDRGVVRR